MTSAPPQTKKASTFNKLLCENSVNCNHIHGQAVASRGHHHHHHHHLDHLHQSSSKRLATGGQEYWDPMRLEAPPGWAASHLNLAGQQHQFQRREEMASYQDSFVSQRPAEFGPNASPAANEESSSCQCSIIDRQPISSQPQQGYFLGTGSGNNASETLRPARTLARLEAQPELAKGSTLFALPSSRNALARGVKRANSNGGDHNSPVAVVVNYNQPSAGPGRAVVGPQFCQPNSFIGHRRATMMANGDSENRRQLSDGTNGNCKQANLALPANERGENRNENRDHDPDAEDQGEDNDDDDEDDPDDGGGGGARGGAPAGDDDGGGCSGGSCGAGGADNGEEGDEEDEDSGYDYGPALTEILNEKKLALSAQPDVVKFLNNLQ